MSPLNLLALPRTKGWDFIYFRNTYDDHRGKLHLVDLAGSERIKKSGVGGQLATEAKYINLSLHYLEQVGHSRT